MKIASSTRSQVSLLIAAMAAVVASCSFSIVWMQQQISRVAANCSEMETALDVDRLRLGSLDQEKAERTQPVVLQSMVMGQLRPVAARQTVIADPRTVLPASRAFAASGPYERPSDRALMQAGLAR